MWHVLKTEFFKALAMSIHLKLQERAGVTRDPGSRQVKDISTTDGSLGQGDLRVVSQGLNKKLPKGNPMVP